MPVYTLPSLPQSHVGFGPLIFLLSTYIINCLFQPQILSQSSCHDLCFFHVIYNFAMMLAPGHLLFMKSTMFFYTMLVRRQSHTPSHAGSHSPTHPEKGHKHTNFKLIGTLHLQQISAKKSKIAKMAVKIKFFTLRFKKNYIGNRYKLDIPNHLFIHFTDLVS